MSDQWRGSVLNIAGRPVVAVELVIRRSVLVDEYVFESIELTLREGTRKNRGEGELEESGLRGVADMFDAAKNSPPAARKFFSIPWTNTDNETISLLSLNEIIEKIGPRAYWRVDGSAKEGFVGFLNFGGKDRKVSLSESKIPEFEAEITKYQESAKKDKENGNISEAAERAIDALCVLIKNDIFDCLKHYLERKENQQKSQRERDAAERSRVEKEMGIRDEAKVTGDFPGNYGEKMRGQC